MAKEYKTHRKVKLLRVCGKCGAKMSLDKYGNWVCPNKRKR